MELGQEGQEVAKSEKKVVVARRVKVKEVMMGMEVVKQEEKVMRMKEEGDCGNDGDGEYDHCLSIHCCCCSGIHQSIPTQRGLYPPVRVEISVLVVAVAAMVTPQGHSWATSATSSKASSDTSKGNFCFEWRRRRWRS